MFALYTYQPNCDVKVQVQDLLVRLLKKIIRILFQVITSQDFRNPYKKTNKSQSYIRKTHLVCLYCAAINGTVMFEVQDVVVRYHDQES